MVFACRALRSSTALLTRVEMSPQPEDGKPVAITALVIGTLQIIVVGFVGKTQPLAQPSSGTYRCQSLGTTADQLGCVYLARRLCDCLVL